MKLEINDLSTLRFLKSLFLVETFRLIEEKELEKRNFLQTSAYRNFLHKELWKLIEDIDEYLKTK